MSFIQIIDCRTDQPEALQAIAREWEEATEAERTLRRSILTQDRHDLRRYVMMTFFDLDVIDDRSGERPAS